MRASLQIPYAENLKVGKVLPLKREGKEVGTATVMYVGEVTENKVPTPDGIIYPKMIDIELDMKFTYEDRHVKEDPDFGWVIEPDVSIEIGDEA